MKKILIAACIAAASITAIPVIAQTPSCPKTKTECRTVNKKCTDCVYPECKECKDCPTGKVCDNCRVCEATNCPNAPQCEGKYCQPTPCDKANAQCPRNNTPPCKQECVKK